MRPALLPGWQTSAYRRFLIASSIIAIMAQRLVRVNCVKCKEPYNPDPRELRAATIPQEALAKAQFMKGRGCNHCRQRVTAAGMASSR